jgi:hypothetical protein
MVDGERAERHNSSAVRTAGLPLRAALPAASISETAFDESASKSPT